MFSEFGADGPSHVLIGFDGFGHRLIKKETLGQFTGLTDKNRKDIYEGDIVYLAGYGSYTCEFPVIELYEAGAEGDIGAILCNIYEDLTKGAMS